MKRFLLLIILIFSFVAGKAQNEEAYSILEKRGEIHFSFEEKNKEKINELSKIISIEKIDKTGNVFAYANREEFEQFLEKGYSYLIIPLEKNINTKSISMASSIDEMQHWDRYPTYRTYLQLMESFQYPNICKIDTIGYSVKKRLILSARISNGDGTPKPEFFYSSTMHGDEVTGFLLMLRLIDYLLSNYGEDENITQLINSIDIYINPNANPDGTYLLSDNDISGAKRYNANNKDLNRNYPNPFSTSNITTLQIENEAMINYIKDHHFVMSANIHGGAEVINFPWDSYYSSEKRPADSLWWVSVSRQFVDSCWGYSRNSFLDTDNSGITYGGDWYKVSGGRQDYVNAALNLRELTMEISTIKMLPTDSLNSYWEMLRQPLLNYIEQASFGIRGVVTDSLTQKPVKAKIWIENHDDNESFVYSNLGNGYFYRPISSGTYDLTVYAKGYNSKTIKNVSIEDRSTTSLSIDLSEDLNKTEEEFKIYPNPAKDFAFIECIDNILSIIIHDTNGKRIAGIQNINQQNYVLNTKNFHSGVYIITIETEVKKSNQKLIIY